MLPLVALLFVLSIAPISVSAISCYSCKHPITVNYTVTSDRIPSFSECQLVDNATQCSVSVTWKLGADTTSAIVVESQRAVSTNAVLQDMVIGIAFMDMGPDEETPLLAHNAFYSCMTSDKCNDEMGLKKILRSLVIEDTLRQELSSLIQVVSPFNPRSAACFEFNNATGYCPPKDLTNCQRCQISIDQLLSPKQEACATCPQFTINTNMVMHSRTFLLNNRTQIADHVQLDCQVTGCNSIDNINRVYKASKITFDFGEFFKNSSE